MNSLEALAATMRKGAHIKQAPSWQAGADLAAGHLVRRLANYAPAPVPLHLMFQPSRLASPRIRAVVGYLAERRRGIDPLGVDR
jgi:DNA-binding transcriptional LysR family regulator